MQRKYLIVLILLTVASYMTFAGGKGENGEAAQAPLLEGYKSATEAGVNVQWKVDGSSLHVQISAATSGWVAVGFDPSNMMKDANIIIGYVAGGEVFIRDDYGTGNVRHGADTANGGVDNLSNVSGEETEAGTSLRFTIPLDSGDSMDKPLKAGETYRMIVAQGSRDDFGSVHAKRGGVNITL